MPSRFETNLGLQGPLVREILDAPPPAWQPPLKKRRHLFVGIGTSFHAAQIARHLWRRCVSPDAEAVHSFDFAHVPQAVREDDVVVLITHGGSKSFTTDAAKIARRAGAVTIGVTRKGSPWTEALTHRLETCEKEDSGVHSKSFAAALALIIRMIGDKALTAAVKDACAKPWKGPTFPKVAETTDILLIGDGLREWVAREISLKLQEAAYLRARPFGIEEFLHGPRISAGSGSLAVCFTEKSEPRWKTALGYLKIIEVPTVEVQAGGAAGWLKQIFWGQRFTVDSCARLDLDPDDMRSRDPRYRLAREKLSL